MNATKTFAQQTRQTVARAFVNVVAGMVTLGAPAVAFGQSNDLPATPQAPRKACMSLADAHSLQQQTYRAVLGLASDIGGDAEARVDSGRPADADSWQPGRGSDR